MKFTRTYDYDDTTKVVIEGCVERSGYYKGARIYDTVEVMALVGGQWTDITKALSDDETHHFETWADKKLEKE